MESKIKKKQTHRKEIRFVVTRSGGAARGNWMKVVTRYILPVIRSISREVMTTLVNTAIWCI